MSSARSGQPPTAGDRLAVAAALLVGVGAAVTSAVSVVRAWSVTVQAAMLAVALFAGAVAVRLLAARAQGLVEARCPRRVEPLPSLSSRRRKLLGVALLSAGVVVPVVGVLRRGRVATTTSWREGVRLVGPEGRPLRVGDVPLRGVSTVWPEDARHEEKAAAILVRLTAAPRPPTRLEWVVEQRLVAYSKLCTHMGCPVGLYLQGTESLFCPCHQATFDATRGALPTFGPAARPLPQLPLGVDAAGYLVALGDFPDRVGPSTG